jgi:hypothetical protein
VIDITNLENGKTVRVIVVADLKTSGLLATLSRSSAEAIGLNENSVCRIRMTQPSDDIAFSRYRQGPLPSAAPETVEAENPELQSSLPIALPPTLSGIFSSSILATNTAASAAAGMATAEPSLVFPAPASPAFPSSALAAAAPTVAAPTVTAAAVTAPAVTVTAAKEPPAATTETNLILNSAENRIPVGEQPAFDPEEMIAPINGTVYYMPETASPFTVPIINTMQTGMWYVQVAAFSHSDSVKSEINRIGPVHPRVVQITETDSGPVYRVLLGPLNQGESGAMLQRFKSIGYNDAFIRSN